MLIPVARRVGFTLVELLVVIAMIGVLVALVQEVAWGVEYPLRVSDNGRYLVDQRGEPFLIVGDTAWSLIAQLDESDIVHYLDDRRARGFNAIIVNLIEHKFSTSPPKTKAGLAPFHQPDDVSTWNAAYFDFAHRVVKLAHDRGICVWLFPAYLGYGGRDEGFFKELKASGPENVHAYGRFVGTRFKDLPNIVWVLGGDYLPAPADRWTAVKVGQGIRQVDSDRLMSYHGSRTVSVGAAFCNDPWLTVNNIYPGKKSTRSDYLAEYERTPVRPYFSIEAIYEQENDATPDLVRRLAYWPLLAGGCGQFFGNNPIWRFDGPGLFPSKVTWKEALDGQGSRDMTRLRDMFAALPWQQLVPEKDHSVITAGHGAGEQKAFTARTPDGRLAITYVPVGGEMPRRLTVNLGQFSGMVTVRWFNPADGSYRTENGSPLGNKGTRELVVPRGQADDKSDWLLVMSVK